MKVIELNFFELGLRLHRRKRGGTLVSFIDLKKNEFMIGRGGPYILVWSQLITTFPNHA